MRPFTTRVYDDLLLKGKDTRLPLLSLSSQVLIGGLCKRSQRFRWNRQSVQWENPNPETDCRSDLIAISWVSSKQRANPKPPQNLSAFETGASRVPHKHKCWFRMQSTTWDYRNKTFLRTYRLSRSLNSSRSVYRFCESKFTGHSVQHSHLCRTYRYQLEWNSSCNVHCTGVAVPLRTPDSP